MGLLRRREEKFPEPEGAEAHELADFLEHRKRVEEVIGERGGGYWELIESSPSLIQSVTPDGRFFYVNRAWLETLGYAPDEVEQLIFLDIIHPDSKAHCMEVFQQLMSGVDFVRICSDFITKDGARVPVEGNVSCRFEGGQPAATRGIFRRVSREGEICKDEISEPESADEETEVLNGVPLEDLYLTFRDLTGK